MDDKNTGESTILSNSEKMRKEVDEDEGGDLGEEEEVTEEDESENDEEEEQQLDGIKLSKNPLVVKDPWTYGEDMDLKKLVESNHNLGFAKTQTSHCVGGVCVIRRKLFLLLLLPLRPLYGIMCEYDL